MFSLASRDQDLLPPCHPPRPCLTLSGIQCFHFPAHSVQHHESGHGHPQLILPCILITDIYTTLFTDMNTKGCQTGVDLENDSGGPRTGQEAFVTVFLQYSDLFRLLFQAPREDVATRQEYMYKISCSSYGIK